MMVNASINEESVALERSRIVPITVEQFHEMIRTGIISDGAPIELIEGLLLWKDRCATEGHSMGHDPRHALLVKRLIRILQSWVATVGCHVQSQLPVTLTDTSEPEPDVAIIRGAEEDFDRRHPGPGEIVVAIEVAGSSLKSDRTTKLKLYAAAGVPTYWIVNLQDALIETYTLPDSAQQTYHKVSNSLPGDMLPLDVGGNSILVNVRELLA